MFPARPIAGPSDLAGSGEDEPAGERTLAPLLAGAVVTCGAPPAVMADPVQLAQVFSNLVSNAIRFQREGVPLAMEVSASRIGGMVEFSVRDNGIGIEEEYFDRIFVIIQPPRSRDACPGTGIGLAIVKRILDRHGGRIRVEAAPGEGATFFTLPAV